MKKLVLVAASLGAGVAAASAYGRTRAHWGSTSDEVAMSMPGDAYLGEPAPAATAMTRAISISAAPEVVWPWLAQLGRGAGWYSHYVVDNGGKTSARHIVSWIPEPHIGDASAIGWLRDLEPGRALTWWLAGQDMPGTTLRMVTDLRIEPEDDGSRLVIRISGDATGFPGPFALRTFEAVDALMAIRQLRGIKARAEAFGTRTADPSVPETGARDQYQLYETIWSSGERAGLAGHERAAVWRRDAEAAGALS